MFSKSILFSACILFFAVDAFACDSCTIPRLGKNEALVLAQGQNKNIYVEYLFEQKNYDVMDPHEAHALHHSGHDFHDKTTEDFHHLRIGGRPSEKLELFADIPYVIRRSLEVDDHSILGSKQVSEGLGDMNLIGQYDVWADSLQSVSAVAGIKVPTGNTKEKNSEGTLFEPELQPGSGSVDYILGGVYGLRNDRFSVVGNMSYVFKNDGTQDFRYGDIFTTSLYGDYLINPGMKNFLTRFGVDLVYQDEQEHSQDGVPSEDSGGQTILLGPVVKVNSGDHISLFTTFLYPVSQNLGGVHQELDYEWTVGSQLSF